MNSRILHVEDNVDDVMLTQMAFRKAGIPVEFEVAADADQAIAALKIQNGGGNPVCVLLDVKLPGRSGLDVLAWIRQQPHLKRVPVIMLTSSLLGSDINEAYDLGVNSYLLKPSDLESLVNLARTLGNYWLQTNTRPVNA